MARPRKSMSIERIIDVIMVRLNDRNCNLVNFYGEDFKRFINYKILPKTIIGDIQEELNRRDSKIVVNVLSARKSIQFIKETIVKEDINPLDDNEILTKFDDIVLGKPCIFKGYHCCILPFTLDRDSLSNIKGLSITDNVFDWTAPHLANVEQYEVIFRINDPKIIIGNALNESHNIEALSEYGDTIIYYHGSEDRGDRMGTITKPIDQVISIRKVSERNKKLEKKVVEIALSDVISYLDGHPSEILEVLKSIQDEGTVFKAYIKGDIYEQSNKFENLYYDITWLKTYLIEKNIITRRKELMNLKILSIDVENDKIIITI